METQTETPTKEVPVPEHIYKKLEQRAKAEGKTPDEYAEKLLLRAMNVTYDSATCPYCKKTIWIPTIGPVITKEAFQQRVKEDLLESKRAGKRA